MHKYKADEETPSPLFTMPEIPKFEPIDLSFLTKKKEKTTFDFSNLFSKPLSSTLDDDWRVDEDRRQQDEWDRQQDEWEEEQQRLRDEEWQRQQDEWDRRQQEELDRQQEEWEEEQRLREQEEQDRRHREWMEEERRRREEQPRRMGHRLPYEVHPLYAPHHPGATVVDHSFVPSLPSYTVSPLYAPHHPGARVIRP